MHGEQSEGTGGGQADDADRSASGDRCEPAGVTCVRRRRQHDAAEREATELAVLEAVQDDGVGGFDDEDEDRREKKKKKHKGKHKDKK